MAMAEQRSQQGASSEGTAFLEPVPLSELREPAYSHIFRLCLRALADVAREGVAIPIADSEDLVHEFLTNEWDGICRRYDPDRAAFKSYVYGAFVRFARRAGRRLIAWRRQLSDLQEMAAASRVVESQHEQPADMHKVRTALGTVPALERELLLDWLHGRATVREQARRHGLTRYGVRARLVDALGRAAVSLGERGAIGDQDWRVACALWRDGFSVRDAALFLSLPAAEIQSARERVFQQLASAAGGSRQLDRRVEMGTDDALYFLNTALAHPGDGARLADVEKHSDEILAALKEMDQHEDDALAKFGKAIPTEWLAKVYDALAGPETADSSELEAARRLEETNDASERSIGMAFRDVLVPDLPSSAFEEAFKGCEPAHDLVKVMSDDPSVQGAEGAAWPLAAFGVSPYMVLQAAKATASFVHRMERQKRIEGEAVLEPVPGMLAAHKPIECAAVFRQIHRTTGAPQQIVPHLHYWMVRVAAHRPLFYPRFVTEIVGEGVVLRSQPGPVSLKDMWGERRLDGRVRG